MARFGDAATALWLATNTDTGTTSAEVDQPIFDIGDVVMNVEDVPAVGSNATVERILYEVVQVILGTKLNSITEAVIIDQVEDAEAPCDGSTARALPQGFDHDTNPSTIVVLSSAASRPWFYLLRATSGPNVGQQFVKHQVLLNIKANMETYIAAALPAMWT